MQVVAGSLMSLNQASVLWGWREVDEVVHTP